MIVLWGIHGDEPMDLVRAGTRQIKTYLRFGGSAGCRTDQLEHESWEKSERLDQNEQSCD